MASLNASTRNGLPSSDFAVPGQRKYPVDTENRARNALARVSQFGSPALKAKVRSKVSEKFPGIKVKTEGVSRTNLSRSLRPRKSVARKSY